MNYLWRSVNLKVNRAEDQISALSRQIDEWFVQNKFEYEAILLEEDKGVKIVLKKFKEVPQLDCWSLLFGECIHNLRSALDNLAFALACLKKDPPENAKGIFFPIFEDAADFAKKARRCTSQLSDESAKIIEMLQPFNRDGSGRCGRPEDDALLMLQLFNNLDKHQIPSVALFAPHDLIYDIAVEFHNKAHADENLPPNAVVSNKPIVPGEFLVEYKTTQPVKKVEYHIEGVVMVAVSGLAQPVSVGFLLVGLHQYVKLVVLQFQHFFEQQEN